MNYLRKFGQSIIKSLKVNSITPKELQEQIDFHRTAVLLSSYSWYKKKETIVDNKRIYPIPNEEENESFWTLADKSSPKEIKQNVNLSLDSQIQELFKKLNIHSKDIQKKITRNSRDSKVEKINLVDLVGYELECRESSIRNSGMVIYICAYSFT